MLTLIPNLLTREDVAKLRAIARRAEFVEGTITAGRRLVNRKNNLQMKPDAAGKGEVDSIVLAAIQRNALFQSVVLPRRIVPPTLSIYRDGMTYGSHVDAALMDGVRADVSMTVFLNDPASYDGGALTLMTGAGEQEFKLMPGEAVVYATSAFHWVTPVTRGERLAAVTWAQSAIRNAEKRAVLHDLRTVIERLGQAVDESDEIMLLVKTHSNLLRMWAEP